MDETPQAGGPAGSVLEARLTAVLESISDGFYALDRDWRYVIFNRAAEAYFGVSREVVLGQMIWDIFPQGLGTPFERACRLAMDQKIATTYETPSRLRPDRILELRIVPMGDVQEGANTFRVYAHLDKTDAAWLPGMIGEARLEIEKKPLAWVWTHRLIDWLRLKTWL